MRGSAQGGNPDGWGVAYYDGVAAILFREPVPAVESPMVQFLNDNAPASELIISHVRRATLGDRVTANTQPFQRVLGGHTHIFAHNGFVPPMSKSKTSSWLMPQGDTDSEQLFCHLLGELEPLWRGGSIPALEKRLDIVEGFARGILKRGASNFLYSDGVSLFAHGHRHTVPGEALSNEPGLYINLYEPNMGSDTTLPCKGIGTEGRCSYQALVATLPLNDHKWEPLRAGEIACFEAGQRIR